MLHTVAGLLAEGTVSSPNVKVAFIGAAALVLAAAIPAILSTREREPRSVRDLRATQQQQREDYEAELRGHADCRDEVDRLERLLWLHRIDPKTGHVMHDGQPPGG